MWGQRARIWGLGLVGAAAVVLAGCGGGGTVVARAAFEPKRLVSFGDELSTIEDKANNGNGRKYSVNGFKPQTAPGVPLQHTCALYPIWNQAAAEGFGVRFPECKDDPSSTTTPVTPTGLIYARPGARVADVQAQIDAHVRVAGSFNRAELVTVLAGTHDVLALYRQFDGNNREALKAQAEAAGSALAEQVNRVAQLGGRVVVSTMPDLGLSPFALAEEAKFAGSDRKGLLRDLTDRFNARLRVGLLDDGTRIGLVLLSEEVMRKSAAIPFGYQGGYKEVSKSACVATVQAPLCATNTLQVDANGVGIDPNSYMWADDIRPGPRVHAELAGALVYRARLNPF
jgi:outer membrane lipase/esterase